MRAPRTLVSASFLDVVGFAVARSNAWTRADSPGSWRHSRPRLRGRVDHGLVFKGRRVDTGQSVVGSGHAGSGCELPTVPCLGRECAKVLIFFSSGYCLQRIDVSRPQDTPPPSISCFHPGGSVRVTRCGRRPGRRRILAGGRAERDGHYCRGRPLQTPTSRRLDGCCHQGVQSHCTPVPLVLSWAIGLDLACSPSLYLGDDLGPLGSRVLRGPFRSQEGNPYQQFPESSEPGYPSGYSCFRMD